MSRVAIKEESLINLANLTRLTANTTESYDIDEMVEILSTAGSPEREEITITENGIYEPDTYGFSKVEVSVNPVLEDITITENGSYKSEQYGYNQVDVNVQPELEELTATTNGVYTPKGDGFSKVTVDCPVADIPEGVFNYTGDINYLFRGGNWDWALQMYGNQMTANNITSMNYTFNQSKVSKIPFAINFSPSSSNHSTSCVFEYANKLTELPTLVNCKPSEFKFTSCENLREISDEWIDSIDWSYIDSQTGSYSEGIGPAIKNCYSLRKFPRKLFTHGNRNCTSAYSMSLNSIAYCCRNMDEATDIPIIYTKPMTSNIFSSPIDGACRLKNFTFETPDGQPKVVEWKNQTLNFAPDPGSFGTISNNAMMESDWLRNSGITMDKEVYDDATYQALKNDPDWWYRTPSGAGVRKEDCKYSRYNHDSAVATINSLPDTSAYLAANGGTNTIMFKARGGWGTDGGAISNLTEEEIAVATAKGWTVTLVD